MTGNVHELRARAGDTEKITVNLARLEENLGHYPEAVRLLEIAQVPPEHVSSRIAQGRMTANDLDIEPAGKTVQRMVGEIRLDRLRQQPDIKRQAVLPCDADARTLAREHRDVETDRVPDQNAIAGIGGELGPDLGK
jgi:hypothetical protein